MPTATTTPTRTATFLRAPDVQRALGIKRSALYARMASGVLPRPVKFGRASLWIASEVDAIAFAIMRGATLSELESLTASLIAARGA